MGVLRSDEVYDTVECAINTIEDFQNSLFEVNGKLVNVLPEVEALILGDLHGDYRSLRNIMRKTRLKKSRIGGILPHRFHRPQGSPQNRGRLPIRRTGKAFLGPFGLPQVGAVKAVA